MQDIRKVLCWIFLANALLHLVVACRVMLFVIQRHNAFLASRSLLMGAVFQVVVAAICGYAWWALWKGKPSGRAWAVAASASYLVLFVGQFVVRRQPSWDHHVGALVIGVIGMVVFLRNYQPPYSRRHATP